MRFVICLVIIAVLCLRAGGEVQPYISETKVSQERFHLSVQAYKPTYFLPLTYNPDPNSKPFQQDEDQSSLNSLEVKFQISLLMEVFPNVFDGRGDVLFAYSQVAYWQAYNDENAAPFRTTDYEPELLVEFDGVHQWHGFQMEKIRMGFVHHSNGQSDPSLSRSWNRLYAQMMMRRGNFLIAFKPWWRIPEGNDVDENPDIERFYGYGECLAAYQYRDHVWSMLVRNNLRSDENKGAVELGWSFPISNRVKGYLQYFHGYGETLLDYNTAEQRIGLGIMINDWL